MSLRVPSSIRYSLEIPEINKTISYRALKVGEQKKLLTVIELKDPKAMINTIVDIVRGITFGELDLAKTPMYIVDYVFLKSFIKSSGAKSQAEFTCGGMVEKEEIVVDEEGNETVAHTQTPCGSKHQLLLNLEDAGIKYPEDYHSSVLIKIDDEMSIKLKMPDFESFKRLDLEQDVIAISDQYIFSGIEYILEGEDMRVPGVDFSFEEMVSWINELDAGVLEKISLFFANVPELALKLDVTCPKCGKKEGFELQGLEDFFL